MAWQRAGEPVWTGPGRLQGIERLSGKPIPAAGMEAQRLRDAAALPAAAPCHVSGGLSAVARPASATPLPPVRRGDRGRLLERPAARPARVPKPHRRDTCVAPGNVPLTRSGRKASTGRTAVSLAGAADMIPGRNRPVHNRDERIIATVTVTTPTTSMMAPLAIIARKGTLPEP